MFTLSGVSIDLISDEAGVPLGARERENERTYN